jgi:acyl-CoA synthetase (NDP forming)
MKRAPVPPAYIDDLRALGVPYFPSPDRAFRALARLTESGARDLSACEGRPIKVNNLPATGGIVAEYKAKAILGPLGIPFPKSRFVTSVEDAEKAALEIGFPVAIKAQSAQLSHKSDAGGVKVGLADASALRGWNRLHHNITTHCPESSSTAIEAMATRHGTNTWHPQ